MNGITDIEKYSWAHECESYRSEEGFHEKYLIPDCMRVELCNVRVRSCYWYFLGFIEVLPQFHASAILRWPTVGVVNGSKTVAKIQRA